MYLNTSTIFHIEKIHGQLNVACSRVRGGFSSVVFLDRRVQNVIYRVRFNISYMY